MNLYSDAPFWLMRHGIVNSYPSLSSNLSVEVAVMGAGISGVLVADALCKKGYDVTILDRRHAGTGSTAASTSLLQYEIDTPLHKLIRMVGQKFATRSYELCRKAIYDVETLCRPFKDPDLFALKPSFQFASYQSHVTPLAKEFELRRQNGFRLKWMEQKDIFNKFGFKKPAGILSEDGAEANAYKLTHRLLEKNIQRGLNIFDNTEIVHITHHKKGVALHAKNGNKIKARKLVIACGYESQQYIPQKVQDLNATYAIASEPFNAKKFWFRNSLIWETAMPYLYLRTTGDNRIIIGGKDVPFSNPNRRDHLLQRKAKALEEAFSKLFPSLGFKTDFKWAGTFASSKDGLPYIGSIRQLPHTYFALAFGGNGVTFSMIAAQIIADLITGQKNEDAEIFKFDR